MQEPDRERLYEEYRAALQTYVFEGTAFWNRITAFVLLNSALLVARNALPPGRSADWMRVGVGVLGLAAVLLWGHTALRAHHLLAFWIAMLRDIEQRLGMERDAPYHMYDAFLHGGRVKMPGGALLRLPLLARVNVNDSTSLALTLVFAVVWIISIVRLS
ncbi:MAG TPA: hypothetical protein VH916_04205 [Dehalococcoidia bacterium]|jgi:hypothetical protein